MFVILVFYLQAIADAKRLSSVISPASYKSVNERVNNGPTEYPGSVDFGHVYRNNFKVANFRKQVDRDDDESEPMNAKKLHYSRKPQWTPKPDNLIFLSPREEIQYYSKHQSPDTSGFKEMESNNTQLKRLSRPTWYDFPKLLERNLANPSANRGSKITQTKDHMKLNKIDNNARVNSTDYFEENAFYMKSDRNSRNLNWTTCDEFARRAVFHPDDVVNTQWLPFYIWSTRGFASSTIYAFSYPTKKIVQHYKTSYKPYLKSVNWYKPKLLLKERREILLIAGDRRGLFLGIPEQELPAHVDGMNITLPILTLRMKIHDPYLALMFCDERYAVIMAELGTGPDNDNDKALEASTLKFRGIGRPAHRDLDGERLAAELKKKRTIEAEARKIIRIENPLGDVDFYVKHS